MLHQYSFDVRNVVKNTFEGNIFGFVTKPPFMVLDFDKYVTGGSCSSKDLSYNDIDVSFKDNVSFRNYVWLSSSSHQFYEFQFHQFKSLPIVFIF